ncbi:PREDICTED: glutathione S-transferase T3-like isoform X2 [Camelina sativa]|uniref:Glutathione S-transferase T3-like isoform X2 n=1 Tax=Camelina sativa TaxID=90675 RepID=A0ABM1R1X9_CAMSA|nr:PREDICTED: glutathione S-transferase T3-like isoform X2 [Camelina sativa]
MDSDTSMNPSPGFFDLLQSQHETYMLVDSPYESQCSDQPPAATPPAGNHRARHTWLPVDDLMLVSGWLNTSKDPITSNEQRSGAFWGRIADYVADCPNVVGRPKRDSSHCKQRWGKVNDTMCKFVGCYDAATREKTSGQNEDDVMKLANQIYFNDHKKKFTFEHAWRELRYDQKWCASTSAKDTRVKRTRVDATTDPSSSQPVDVEDDPMMTRPPGVKAAKRKAKKNNNTQADVEVDPKAWLEFQMQEVARMYEMKEKDFANKEIEFAMKEKHR